MYDFILVTRLAAMLLFGINIGIRASHEQAFAFVSLAVAVFFGWSVCYRYKLQQRDDRVG